LSELNALYMAIDTVTLLLAVVAIFGVVTTTGVLQQIGAGACNPTWWPLYRYEEDRGLKRNGVRHVEEESMAVQLDLQDFPAAFDHGFASFERGDRFQRAPHALGAHGIPR
jgi:hypothetical protein